MSGEGFVKEKAVAALFAAFKNYTLSPKDALSYGRVPEVNIERLKIPVGENGRQTTY